MKSFGMRKARVFAVVLAALIGLTGVQHALAQGQLTPVITVNNSVVTRYELTQRIRLLEAFRTPGDLNALARNALTEDRLKQQEMARFNLELSDEELQQELEVFAARANLNLVQLTQILSENGVDIGTLEDFVSIGVLWQRYVGGRFGRSVNISDADVERAIARQGAAPTQLEVLLSEIIIAAPPERAAQAQSVAEQIARMRSFAEFESAARQVSALPSRDVGGRLDWLPIGNYPPQLQRVILDLDRGEVSAPIDIPNGIALFQLRGVREAARPLQAPRSIDYAAYYIPGGQTEFGLQQAARIRDQVDTCDDLYGVARDQPAEVLDRVTLPPSDIVDDIALELARLDPGETSTNLTRDNGQTLVFLMLCARNMADADATDPGAVRRQLRSQRLTALAEALIEDLRAAADIRS